MRALDNDALICDFAEYYHIIDYTKIPVKTAAILACGLPQDSRIMLKLAGARINLADTLNAIIADQLRVLVWMRTKDAEHHRNYPKSILEILTGKNEETEVMAFDSGADFEAARAAILAQIARKQDGR